MSYNERIEIYKRIEELRQRPLITYVTSLRPGAGGQMAADSIAEFTRQILAIPDSNSVDVLIISNGGDPTVAWRISSMLRERFDTVGVLLPFTAYSAATLLALGANEIVMHPFSNLGPVDPQLTSSRPGEGQEPQVSQFGSEDLVHYLAFVKEDVGITDQKELQRSFEMLCQDVGAIPVGVAKRSAQLSMSLGRKLLNLHMDDPNEASSIAESLNKSFFHHGYPVGRSEAEKIGLPVIKPDPELEELLWNVWLSFEEEMECTQPFSPLEIVLSESNNADLLGPVSQVQLPANLPQQVMQQAYNNILQQINIVQITPADFELFHATVESKYCKSYFKTKGRISAVRQPDMNIALSIAEISKRWIFEENSAIVKDTLESQSEN